MMEEGKHDDDVPQEYENEITLPIQPIDPTTDNDGAYHQTVPIDGAHAIAISEHATFIREQGYAPEIASKIAQAWWFTNRQALSLDAKKRLLAFMIQDELSESAQEAWDASRAPTPVVTVFSPETGAVQ